jgi:rod shape-determining protein MreC
VTDRQLTLVRLLLLWLLLEFAAAAQVRTASGRSLLATWVSTAVHPVTTAAESAVSGLAHAAAAFGSSQRLVADNRRLREELEFALARQTLLEADLEAALDLVRVVELADVVASSAVAARCVFRDPFLGSMQLHIAEPAVVPPDTPVLGPGGVAGRVVRSRGDTLWVELVTHPAAAVAVQLPGETTSGLAVGGSGRDLEVRFVPRSATVLVGQRLVTSGADGIYPVGLPVAEVTRVRETDSPFLEIRARPVVDVNDLRAVLLLPQLASAAGGTAP